MMGYNVIVQQRDGADPGKYNRCAILSRFEAADRLLNKLASIIITHYRQVSAKRGGDPWYGRVGEWAG
jgi:hypothetical protein